MIQHLSHVQELPHLFSSAAARPGTLPAASVLSVTVDGTSNDSLNWQFSQPVTVVNGFGGAALQADDGSGLDSPDSLGNVIASVIVARYIGKLFSRGNAWQMLASPDPDLASAGGFLVPESGTTG